MCFDSDQKNKKRCPPNTAECPIHLLTLLHIPGLPEAAKPDESVVHSMTKKDYNHWTVLWAGQRIRPLDPRASTRRDDAYMHGKHEQEKNLSFWVLHRASKGHAANTYESHASSSWLGGTSFAFCVWLARLRLLLRSLANHLLNTCRIQLPRQRAPR